MIHNKKREERSAAPLHSKTPFEMKETRIQKNLHHVQI
jgi:hypothetical protein